MGEMGGGCTQEGFNVHGGGCGAEFRGRIQDDCAGPGMVGKGLMSGLVYCKHYRNRKRRIRGE